MPAAETEQYIYFKFKFSLQLASKDSRTVMWKMGLPDEKVVGSESSQHCPWSILGNATGSAKRFPADAESSAARRLYALCCWGFREADGFQRSLSDSASHGSAKPLHAWHYRRTARPGLAPLAETGTSYEAKYSRVRVVTQDEALLQTGNQSICYRGNIS